MKKNKRLISVLSAKKKMIESLKKFKNTSEYINFKDSDQRLILLNSQRFVKLKLLNLLIT